MLRLVTICLDRADEGCGLWIRRKRVVDGILLV